MKKITLLSLIAAALAVAVSCHKTVMAPTGTAYLDLPHSTDAFFQGSFGPGDRLYNERATLGRVLFYDGHLSLNNVISCASCHKQTCNFSDNAALSTGYEGRLTLRNAPGIQNISGFNKMLVPPDQNFSRAPLFWDGRENMLLNLVNRPITNHVEMGISDPGTLPEKLAALSYYPNLFEKAYGDATITSFRISECIATFMMSIQSNNSKFERSVRKQATLTDMEQRGLTLFTSTYNCNSCHHVSPVTGYNTNTTFADFQDIGLDRHYSDFGLGAVFHDSGSMGKFKVPVLLNVALTAPYMHDGRFKTLEEVIDHYSHGISPSPNLAGQFWDSSGHAKQMNISEVDKAALVAFLNSLTDITTITDPKFSNPFKIK